jgi:uncharacterized caspase-like protein
MHTKIRNTILEYAVNDAQTFVKSLTTHSDSLFNKVSLFEIYNDQAIKSNIVKAFQEISEQIGPEDVFIFYYAGHGVMSLEQASNISDFFIVTHDVTNLYGEASMLREKAVSATELMDFSVEILAQKQLFILDACHSGGALDAIAMRGDGREKHWLSWREVPELFSSLQRKMRNMQMKSAIFRMDCLPMRCWKF